MPPKIVEMHASVQPYCLATSAHRQMSMPKRVRARTWRPPLPRPAGGPDAAEATRRVLELDAQPSAASIRPPRESGAEGLCQGMASSHSGHLRGIGAPNQQPGRILIPGGGAAGDQEAQNRPVYATPAACPVSMTSWRYGLRRACRLVTRRSHRPRSTWPNQARLAFLAVTHRYKRTHCLWLEQFQITMRCPLMVRRGRPSGAERSVLAPSLLRCNSFAERRHRGEQGEPRRRKPRNAAGAFPGSRSVSRRDMLVSS